MKILFLVLLFSAISSAQVVSGTSHKTADGKYPYFFDDQGHPEVWDDSQQKSYDEKMSATLKKLCLDNAQLGELEKEYAALDSKDWGTLNSHKDLGDKIKTTKDEIIHLSNIVVQGTGQSARVWGCQ